MSADDRTAYIRTLTGLISTFDPTGLTGIAAAFMYN